jgi:RNA polymerase sigma-70 factor (ECF subfamily)
MSGTQRAARAAAPDERDLVRRLQAGEDAAYDELVRENAGRLLTVARRMLASEEDARDAVQDAFLQAFRAIGRFEGEAKLSTWLHRIVVNAGLMRLRTRRRKPEHPIDELLPRFQEDGHRVDPGPAWRSDAPDPVESAELRTLVRDSIERLPEMHRNVLWLRDIEGLSTEEAARMLEVEPATLKVRLHRARQALRTLLHPHLTGRAA